MFFKSLAAIALFAVVLAGCTATSQTPESGSSINIQTASAQAPDVPGTLTFCGQTTKAQLFQPANNFNGIWVGTWVGPGEYACVAYLINVSGGSADIVGFSGPGARSVPAGIRYRHGTITGNTLDYLNGLGTPDTMTLLDPNHLQLRAHNVRTGQDYIANMERVRAAGEEAKAR